MVEEKRNNQQFQHHNGGFVQGIPPMTSSSDFTLPPQTRVSQGYFPPPHHPSTVVPAPSPQNHAPPPRHLSHQVSEKTPNTVNTNAPVVAASATAVGNSTTVIVNPGPAVIEVKDDRLPCGCGSGWFMFILGWFFAIPWYVGACILICGKIDRRERPGHIACAVMAVIFTIALIITSVDRSKNDY